MARRPKTSPIEDIVHLVALLPWWACLIAALLSYAVLHGMAQQPVPVPQQPHQMAQAMTGSIFQGLAVVGQFVVPLVCLAAAALSAANRRQRSKLLETVVQGAAPDVLEGMSWQEFELLVGEAFRLQGYEVTELGGSGPDGGVDLVLRKDREKFLVQCKQWKAFKVGVQVVRELYGVMAAQGAAGGFVVTSGTFTPEAVSFASGRNVRLVDGPKLFGLIQQARAGSTAKRRGATVAATPVRSLRPMAPILKAPTTPFATNSTTDLLDTPPTCPFCAAIMVTRTAKRGSNIGKDFWGCGTYPDCRGTRPIH